MFKFKGISSEDMQVVIEEEEHFIARASQRYEMTEIEGRDGAIFNELGYSVVERPIYVQCLNISKIDDILAWLNGEGEFEYKGRKTTARFYSELEPQRSSCIRIIDTTFIRDPFWYKANEEFSLVKDRKDKTVSGETIDLSDSAEMRCELKISGNSKQETRSGKNLINLANIKQITNNGITCTYNSANNSATFNGVCTSSNTLFKILNTNIISENTKTTISVHYISGKCTPGDNTLNYPAVRGHDQNWSKGFQVDKIGNLSLNNKMLSKTSTLPTGTELVNWDFRFETGDVADNFTVQLMVTKDIDTEYEQYGASPSPDYPSEVECCGDNVNIFEATESSFKDNNDKTYLEYTKNTNEYHTTKASWHRYLASNLELNKSYTVSFDVKSTTNNASMQRFFRIDKVSDGATLKSFDTSILISTEYKRYSLTFIATETSLNLTVRNADGIDAYIRNIKLVKGEDSKYSKYGQGCINEVICNKNFAVIESGGLATSTGLETIASNYYRSDFRKILNNKTITARYNTNSSSKQVVIFEYDKDKNFLRFTNTNSSSHTAVVGDDTKYIRCRFLTEVNIAPTNTQIEEGSIATPYQEHKEQTYTIPTQQPFRKAGDIRDTFIKKNNKWYEHHPINRYVIKGTENISLQNSGKRVYINLWASEVKTLPINPNSTSDLTYKLYCNYLTQKTAGNTWSGIQGISYDYNASGNISYGFDIAINAFTTLQEYIDFFTEKYNSENPFYVDYVLETPLDIECTEEQSAILDQIEKEAKTYKNITHIYSTDNVSPNVEVTYKKDIDTMITNIEQAILSQGGNI